MNRVFECPGLAVFPGLVLLTVALAAGGCTSRPADTWQGTIEERDGVTWVSNPAQGLWSGQQSDDGAPAGFRLELEQVFGVEMEPEDAILGVVGGVTVDDSGNVYVVDREASQLVSFAPDGEVRWRVGRAGEGPGEFNNANWIAWDGADRLYMDNHGATQIDVWDLDGNFLTSQSLPRIEVNQGYIVGMVDRSTLVLGHYFGLSVQGTGLAVLSVDEDPWRKEAEFVAGTKPELGREEQYRLDVGVLASAGSIWAGNRLTYRLEEYDASGTLLRVITGDAPNLVPAIGGRSFGHFRPPMQLPDGQLLVPRHRVTNFDSVEEFRSLLERVRAGADEELRVWESGFDLLDAEGRLLATIESRGHFVETGWARAMGPDGRLYTSKLEPFPQVRRYRVVIEPPS